MLLIDIGNSRLKWALWDGVKYTGKGAVDNSMSDINGRLSQMFLSVPRQEKVLISCVAGDDIRAAIDHWFQNNWQVKVSFAVSQAQQQGLTNCYPDVTSLGIDRWSAMLAAWVKYQKACCVIDCGTAVTLDVIDHKGQHLGGLILPGLATMRSSLVRETHAIDQQQGKPDGLANNTADAVESGCTQLLISGLDSMIKKYREMLSGEMLCIITGGDGVHVAGLLETETTLETDLVLDGLKQMAVAGF